MSNHIKFWSIGQDSVARTWQVRSIEEGQTLADELVEESLGEDLRDAALDFDGYFDEDPQTGELIKDPDALPRLFVVTDAGNLYTKIVQAPIATAELLATEVSKVAARRSYKLRTNPIQDWGFVVAYIKEDDAVYYRQGVETGGTFHWEAEELLDAGPADKVQVVRLKDMRTGIVVRKNDTSLLYVTTTAPFNYGLALTQGSYDQLTVQPTLYYAIIDGIQSSLYLLKVEELTQVQYDSLSTHGASTLYIITDGFDIFDVYVGDTEANKLYQGSTELWGRSTPLPAWFPQNVNGPADLQAYYGTDMSNYFVDVLYCDGTKYTYARCYCNTLNAVSIITNNMSPPTQLRCSYSGNNRRIAVRRIIYNNDGSYFTRQQDNWSTTNITLMSISASIFNPSICIIDWGNTTYGTSAPSGYSFEIIVAN